MWLTSSSIGRKLVMAITGACLVLFVTFHVLMNAVAIVWPTAYNQVCEFLGANWYALIATVGLAALFVIHIIYAVWLTVMNRNARGNDRYNVTARPKSVEWSSQNMLVLGIVVVAFLVVHMIQFWAKMQLQEIMGTEYHVGEAGLPAAMGTLFLQLAFQEWWTPVVYIIGFIALWFHLNHGVWSMFQSCGWNGNVWLCRLKTIGSWWASIVVLLFVAEAAVFTFNARKGAYFTDEALVAQYTKTLQAEGQKKMEALLAEYSSLNVYDAADATRAQEIEQQAQQVVSYYGLNPQFGPGTAISAIKKLGEAFNTPKVEEAAEAEEAPATEAEVTVEETTDTVTATEAPAEN